MLAKLSVNDPHAYAAARSLIRDADVPMRAFDHAIKRDIREAIAEYPPETIRGEVGGFFESDGCICRTKYTPLGPQTVPLCNFTAAIVDETTYDDGIERKIFFGVTGKMSDGRPLPRVEVPAAVFGRLDWVVPSWGSDAIVWPGEAKALPAAIQALSEKTTKRTVYSHTDWRKIGTEWAYLHSAGAITADGVDIGEISVSLAPPLDRYSLPEPPTDEALIDAIRWSLRLLELGGDRIMVPLLGAVYRAPLGPCGLSVSLVGRTGTGKTELAALAQQHFGPGMDAHHLPASWASTTNSLDCFAFLAKDAILAVDDFNPNGGGPEVSRAHRDADRFYRIQGNGSGRSRMRADGSLHPEKPHRCLAISTGEDLIRTHSGRARQWVIEVREYDGIVGTQLTPFQGAAAEGKLAAAEAGYLRWLASRYDKVLAMMQGKIRDYRVQAAGGKDQHARVPTMIAELTLGFRMFLRFAKQVGAISAQEEVEYSERGWKALIEGSAEQTGHHQEANPALTFVRLISSIVTCGRAHLADVDGNAPADVPGLGWRLVGAKLQPSGPRIGWVDGENVYLDADGAFVEVQKFARDQDEPIAVSQATIYKRLHEQGLLAETDVERETLKVRRTIEGQRRSVLCFHAETLFPTAEDPTNPTTSNATQYEATTCGGQGCEDEPDQPDSDPAEPKPSTAKSVEPTPLASTTASPDVAKGNAELVGSFALEGGNHDEDLLQQFEDGLI